MNIPFSPPYITAKEINSVAKVLKSGWLSQGHLTEKFEQEFSKYIGSKNSIAVNSCTSALFLCLKLLDVGKQDEVITTPFTFAATANTIVHCGAKPVFADIDEYTYNIDPAQIEKRITKRTKAIIAVHYGGQPADMTKINKIARKYKIKVIEDAAHATGSSYRGGRKVGSAGNLTCFSFYATKPITTGEGGMITLNNTKMADILKIMRLHGISKDAWKRYIEKNRWYYEIVMPGYKFNTTDINSAIGLEQLKKIESLNQKRKKIREYYTSKLKGLNIVIPKMDKMKGSSYHLYPIRLLNYDRGEFINKMARAGVGTSVHFIPLHLMPYYQKQWKYKKGDFPVCEEIYKGIVSLPIYPQLKKKELDYIIKQIISILG